MTSAAVVTSPVLLFILTIVRTVPPALMTVTAQSNTIRLIPPSGCRHNFQNVLPQPTKIFSKGSSALVQLDLRAVSDRSPQPWTCWFFFRTDVFASNAHHILQNFRKSLLFRVPALFKNWTLWSFELVPSSESAVCARGCHFLTA